MINRPTVVTLVIDAVGIPTLEYLLDKHPGEVSLPNLQAMGLGNLLDERHHVARRYVFFLQEKMPKR